MNNVIKVEHNGIEFGAIVRSTYHNSGIGFFSGENDGLQLGYMNRPDDYTIAPHTHNKVKREVYFTEEILFIRSGMVRVDFYDDNQQYIESYIVRSGDIVILKAGGHGFKVIERADIFEVKQGPYLGAQDKVRFNPITDDLTKIID
jgi:mannose-6-phosphate isomerase-like protein (cupin superfamily)